MSAYREAGSPPTDDGALTKAAAGVVRVDHENGALVVSWHWFSLGSLGYFLGGLGVIASLSVVDIEEAGLLFFVRLLAVLIAVALLYVGATGIFNRTRIVVTDAQVVCKHGPVWASAPSPLRREEIAKVYADSRVVRGAKGSRITYHYVMATLADGRTRTLADGDLTEAKARAAARVLTSYLDLEAPKPAPARSRFANVSVTEAADGEVDVIHDDAALVLSWSWRGRSALVMSFFGLFVSGVAGAFVSVAIEHSAAAMIPGTIFLLFAIFMDYVAIAYALNRTTLTLTKKEIAVRNGPIPWRSSRRLSLAGITQFFVKRELVGDDVEFHVHAIHGANDAAGILVVDAPTMTDRRAKAIEHVIEAYLHIVDAPVKGEF